MAGQKIKVTKEALAVVGLSATCGGCEGTGKATIQAPGAAGLQKITCELCKGTGKGATLAQLAQRDAVLTQLTDQKPSSTATWGQKEKKGD